MPETPDALPHHLCAFYEGTPSLGHHEIGEFGEGVQVTVQDVLADVPMVGGVLQLVGQHFVVYQFAVPIHQAHQLQRSASLADLQQLLHLLQVCVHRDRITVQFIMVFFFPSPFFLF